MTLPASGTIAVSQIQTEFGGANPVSLSEYYRGGAYVTSNNTSVPTSGAISLSNFYGAVKQFAFTISSDQTNANLRTLAIAAGWDQASRLVATISSGVYISSNSTGTPALTVSGSFPAGVLLTNNGIIVGMGGAGGQGGVPGSAGGNGGTAFSTSVAITVTNNGTMAGGGGGGGGGGVRYNVEPFGSGGGGGGGRSSAAANSAAGLAGTNDFDFGVRAQPGTAGTLSSAGTGGLGTLTDSGQRQGSGGAGGDWGTAGSTGLNASTSYYNSIASLPTSGGAAGAAVSGNSNITWIAFGTRTGPIT
jgi:hypothetical protein